jgi:hypothetical protein
MSDAWRDVQIAAAFPQFEAKRLLEHRAEAERRFDTSQLEREISNIDREAEVEARRVFSVDMQRMRGELSTLKPKADQMRMDLWHLQRNYKQELEGMHLKKDQLLKDRQLLFEQQVVLKAKQAKAKKELDAAYEALEEAKGSVEGWHRKSQRSPWLLGNGGKKLPKHAMFGQSFGDLDGLKSDRDAAYEKVRKAKRERADVAAALKSNWEAIQRSKAAVDGVFQHITSIKEGRRVAQLLHQRGARPRQLESELDACIAQCARLEERLREMESSRGEFIAQQAARLGKLERQASVAALQESKRSFLSSFDLPEARTRRQEIHRSEWLMAAGHQNRQ